MTAALCPRHAGSVLHAAGLEVFAGSLLTECGTEGSTLSLLSSEASFFWWGALGGLRLPHIQTPPRSWSTFRASRSNCPLAVAENGPRCHPGLGVGHPPFQGGTGASALGWLSQPSAPTPNIGVRVKVVLKTS